MIPFLKWFPDDEVFELFLPLFSIFRSYFFVNQQGQNQFRSLFPKFLI